MKIKLFKKSKQLLLSSQLLVHFDSTISVMLAHRTSDGVEKPIGFVSCTLTIAEKNYSQVEKEALSCIFSIKRFHTYLCSHCFTLITDHKPLLSFLRTKGYSKPSIR